MLLDGLIALYIIDIHVANWHGGCCLPGTGRGLDLAPFILSKGLVDTLFKCLHMVFPLERMEALYLEKNPFLNGLFDVPILCTRRWLTFRAQRQCGFASGPRQSGSPDCAVCGQPVGVRPPLLPPKTKDSVVVQCQVVATWQHCSSTARAAAHLKQPFRQP